MNIEEYCDALNLELRIIRYPNQNNRYSAAFEDCEIKEDAADSFLTSTYGDGGTPGSAICDYLNKIRGKVLVVGAGSDKRRQYVVPKELAAA